MHHHHRNALVVVRRVVLTPFNYLDEIFGGLVETVRVDDAILNQHDRQATNGVHHAVDTKFVIVDVLLLVFVRVPFHGYVCVARADMESPPPPAGASCRI